MASAGTSLSPEEVRLEGKWVSVGGGTEGDATTERIESLVRNSLVRVAVSADGWDTLYRDPSDGRLWEHFYAQSHLHGGGPPTLAVIATSDAAQKYGAVVPSNTSLERTRGR
jgi:hypothetical protein